MIIIIRVVRGGQAGLLLILAQAQRWDAARVHRPALARIRFAGICVGCFRKRREIRDQPGPSTDGGGRAPEGPGGRSIPTRMNIIIRVVPD